MKKSIILKILVILGVITLNILAIVYLPPFILYWIGCWQIGDWIVTLANKLSSHIK